MLLGWWEFLREGCPRDVFSASLEWRVHAPCPPPSRPSQGGEFRAQRRVSHPTELLERAETAKPCEKSRDARPCDRARLEAESEDKKQELRA